MTINYKRRRNGTTSSTSTTVTQRWPVTRSRALRKAVVATWAAIGQPYPVAYQWIRLTPQGTKRFVRWAV